MELKRLSYRGFGSARPIFPIPEENYYQEQMNRRVEILVKDKLPRK
jgi:flagellar motor protein MotB